jgi:hypothetical protein
MTTPLYDAVAGEPYGRCKTCELDVETQALAERHMDETMKAATGENLRESHSITVLNPSRERRIGRAVESVIDDAILDAIDELKELVEHDHATQEEITAAIGRWSDFADEWLRNVNPSDSQEE